MPPLPRVGSLELGQDLRFQQRSWQVQRAGWACFALVILAALAGLFGHGPLSRAAAASPDGSLAVEYHRFVRMQSPTELRVRFDAAAVTDGEVRIWLDRGYVERIRLQPVVPQPQQVEIGADRLTYVFSAAKLEARGAVTFHLQFQSFGRAHARIGHRTAQVAFGQLVYP